jgi:hypothetical protein
VLLLSLYVLFTPRTGGEALFPYADKVVHLGLFALLAATTRWRFGRGLWAVVAYAVGSELVQGMLLSTRSGDAYDVVADLVGVAAGWLLAPASAPGERQRQPASAAVGPSGAAEASSERRRACVSPSCPCAAGSACEE